MLSSASQVIGLFNLYWTIRSPPDEIFPLPELKLREAYGENAAKSIPDSRFYELIPYGKPRKLSDADRVSRDRPSFKVETTQAARSIAHHAHFAAPFVSSPRLRKTRIEPFCTPIFVRSSDS
jgi:hypothetical protein